MKRTFWGLFLFLSSIFLLRYLLLGHAVYGDGRFYWMYARTVVIEHSLDLRHELRHPYSPEGNNTSEVELDHPLTAEERPFMFHLPIGTAVGYLPFFYVAHGVGNVLGMFGVSILLNGYSDIYQIAVGLGNVFYGTLGLCFIILLLKKYVSAGVAVASTVLMLLGTNLIYYLGIDILNSHPLSFCLSSLFFSIYIPTFAKKLWYHWGILGILVGLLTATRTQEFIFSFLLLAEALYHEYRWIIHNKGDKLVNGFNSCVALLGLFVGFTPQLFVWLIVFGTFSVPYLKRGDAFDFLNPHILGVILNPKTGILWYTPLFLLGFVGLLMQWRRKLLLFGILVLYVFLEFYLIASWNAWDQAASYGMRMLLTCVPVLTLGLAYLLQTMVKRIGFGKTLFIGCLFIVWNIMMIGYFHLVVKDPTIDQGEVTREKVLRRLDSVIERFSQRK